MSRKKVEEEGQKTEVEWKEDELGDGGGKRRGKREINQISIYQAQLTDCFYGHHALKSQNTHIKIIESC